MRSGSTIVRERAHDALVAAMVSDKERGKAAGSIQIQKFYSLPPLATGHK